jgi:hypothetical protein
MDNTQDLSWLDKYIEQQKCNTDIIKSICNPENPADLQEQAEIAQW